jgi:hypothetical protein
VKIIAISILMFVIGLMIGIGIVQVKAQAPQPVPVNTQPLPSNMSVFIVPNNSISVNAPSDKVTVRPSMIKGQTQVSIDISK